VHVCTALPIASMCISGYLRRSQKLSDNLGMLIQPFTEKGKMGLAHDRLTGARPAILKS